MKFFIVEGIIKDVKGMNDTLLKEHMAYTQKVMNQGQYLFSGLKSDQSGGVFMIKAESKEWLEEYLHNEPFYKAGIQEYKIQSVDVHWSNEQAFSWFK